MPTAPYSFAELVQTANEKKISQAMHILPNGQPIIPEQFKEYVANTTILDEMLTTKGTYKGPKINLAETLLTPDASILFPKVISDVMLRPKEPLMIGQTLLSKTVMIDTTRTVQFPTIGAMRAFDLGETGDYRDQYLPMQEYLTEVKVGKSGLAFSISDQVIEESMWDILALYMEAAGYAMLRHKEEKIFNEFTEHGHVVFDNALTDSNAWTSGYNRAGSGNYSITFDNFIDLMGGLVANEYIPTDFIMHPLAWVIFAKDPIIRNVMYTQGQIGKSVWTQIPEFDQQTNVPWNISYQVTPFVPFQLNAQLATGPASGLSRCNITDMYVIDRQNACVVLQREAMSFEKFDDPRRDIQSAKVKERYGVGTLNGGRATAVAKNIRLEQNWAPISSYITYNPS